MHTKVSRLSSEKALRLFYAQEPVTDNPGEGESLAEVEAAATALMRNHVRAIDNSEDDLLLIYLEAAVDYMQNLSDRLLGEHEVELYINKDESKLPLSVSGIQGVTSLGQLYYLSEDADDERPWSKDYKPYSKVPESDDASAVSDWGDSLVREASYGSYTEATLNVSSDKFDEVTGLTGLTYTWEKYSFADAGYIADAQVNPVVLAADGNGDLLTDVTLNVGLYRIKLVALYDDATTETYYRYYEVTDGMDFDNRIITTRYPIHIDIRKGVDLLDDAADEQEDFWKLTFKAGTDFMSLPKQYKQAALLLVGHYYNMREAENIGGITTELKEGVRRLIQSVRQF